MCGQKEKRKTHFTEFSSSSSLAMLVFLSTVLRNPMLKQGDFCFNFDYIRFGMASRKLAASSA